VLLRPSYILSGTAMRVAHNSVDLDNDFETACIVSRDYPVVMSKFVIGWALTTF
jgi:carbamoylphosphate synthase large subunit